MRHPLLVRQGALKGASVPWKLVFIAPALWIALAATAAWPDDVSVAWTVELQVRLLATVTAALVLPSFAFASWYVVAAHPVDRGVTGRALVNHVAAALVSTWIWLGVSRVGARLWGGFVDAPVRPVDLLDRGTPLLVTIGVASYAIAILAYTLLSVVDERQRDALRREELATFAKDAELRALKFQLNPHFLFNALNSISALTSSAPGRAREMCVRLGDFLRRTLALGDRRTVPLGDELDLVRDYLDIEGVRFENRLRVTTDVDETCLDAEVPPLLLQPLVENAVKHGLGSLLGPMDLRVAARPAERSDRVVLSVENTYDADAPPQPTRGARVGLENTRERLARQYGDAQSMDVARDDGWFRVRLELPTRAPGDA